MSKRPTKKAAKWKVGNRVRIIGKIVGIDKDTDEAQVQLEGDYAHRWIDLKALRPAVELFACSPKKKPTTKGAKKK
jgi:hypothetical protein